MKPSKYNFFIPHANRIICFNAVSGKVFSVNQNEYENILSFLKLPQATHPLYSFFEKNKFIVDDNINETDHLILKNRLSVFDNYYTLIINPTLQCNFDCWYCYEKKIIGHMSNETRKNIKKYIENLVTNYQIKGLVLSWFGGEPLLNFNNVIYPISKFAKELMEETNLKFLNTVTTNGYCVNEKMINKFEEIKLNNFQITLDGDKENHDKIRNQKGRPSFEKIISNIINICHIMPDAKIRLRVNYTREVINRDLGNVFNLVPSDIRQKIAVDFQRVWQSTNEIDSPSNDNIDLMNNIKTARNMGFKISLDSAYSVGKCYQCYVDRYNQAHINFDGKVYKCTARDYSEKYVCGKLTSDGEIEWKPGILERMFGKANFDNEKCRQCNILPICLGPCFQSYLEYKNGEIKDFCIKNYKEMSVETFIKEYYFKVKSNHQNKQMERETI